MLESAPYFHQKRNLLDIYNNIHNFCMRKVKRKEVHILRKAKSWMASQIFKNKHLLTLQIHLNTYKSHCQILSIEKKSPSCSFFVEYDLHFSQSKYMNPINCDSNFFQKHFHTTKKSSVFIFSYYIFLIRIIIHTSSEMIIINAME